MRDYLLNKDSLLRQAESEHRELRILQEQRQIETQRLLKHEREARNRQYRILSEQQELRLAQEQQRLDSLSRSRRLQDEQAMRVREDINRENELVHLEQREQARLVEELGALEIEIGTINDNRNSRRQLELAEL